MKKIRINELARELEVKPQRILEILPELGVAEKKTHSSSVDEDVALRLRHILVDGESVEATAARSAEYAELAGTAAAVPEAAGTPTEEAEEPAAKPLESVAHAGESVREETPAAETAREPAPPRMAPEETTVRAPLRPPLFAGPRPSAHSIAPASGPALPTAPRASGIPARPVPSAPKPGQILSGPRQPLPGPGAPAPSASAVSRPGDAVPSAPAPMPAAPRLTATPVRPAPMPGAAIPRPPQPRAAEGASSGPVAGQPLRPQPSRAPLAGQPAARPVVPPSPEIVARLGQPRPLAPRPGLPSRMPASPVPGQPLYRGPIRPGQPIVRGPALPGAPGAPGARGLRARPMHPTSPMRIEPQAPPPTDPQRRHLQGKPGGRVDRHRKEQQEERSLRMPSMRRDQTPAAPLIDREITIADGVTVKELSEKLGVKANLVIRKLVEKKIFATINQTLDVKLAEELSRDFGASANKVSFEEESVQEIEQAEDASTQVKRPPVVTIMGHVDHGKTSLLDAIRLANVAGREAGGITQHIGAYHVEKNGRKIAFIDTPGHEAFTRMRARGAKVTDIVVLVVAADDGVMPQTLEAIDHARAAGVPIVVAINKIDKPDAQPERIKQQLSDRGLLPDDWGGDTVMVEVSAKAKTNLDRLLEMILLVADMQDLKANPERPGMGSVLEAKLDRGRGPVATVLVRNGTLSVGDFFICGSVFGKVRALFDDRGEQTRSAGPSIPVEVLGLESLPEVGDAFQVVTDTAKAKQIVIYRESKTRDQAMSRNPRITLEQLHHQLKAGEVKELNVILKTDVGGTAEVLSDMMKKLSNDKVKIRVLHGGVGAINETDVLLASASNAIVIGFNVRPERNATNLAEKEKVDIRLHTIIYDLSDEMKRAMTGMLEPVFKEVYRGRAAVRDVFRITKVGNVAGCVVQDGALTRDSQVRLLRDNVVVYTGKVDSLKRFKNDASEVKSGLECGVTLQNFPDVKPGDVIEAFVTERVAVEALA